MLIWVLREGILVLMFLFKVCVFLNMCKVVFGNGALIVVDFLGAIDCLFGF